MNRLLNQLHEHCDPNDPFWASVASALKAADDMADILARQQRTRVLNGEIPSERQIHADNCLSAYRSFTFD